MHEHQYKYKIFGISERNAALKLKFYGGFGSPNLYYQKSPTFPGIITPMKNGKYLFYQQSFFRWENSEKVLRIEVEEWEQNEDWNRSLINFPLNFTEETKVSWIFKV